MIRVFKLPSSPSSRKAIAHLEAVGQTVEVRNMNTEPLTFEELKEILSYTDNGVDDIIVKNGAVYKELMEQGVDIESLPLSKFYAYVKYNPRLIKAPITIGNGYMEIGYNEEAFTKFHPRGMKIKDYLKKLEKVREEEDKLLAAGEEIPTGYWGLPNWSMTFSGRL
jgi:regulatory protein spx